MFLRRLEAEVIEVHRRTHLVKGLARLGAGSLAPLLDDAVHALRIGRVSRSALADRAKELLNRDDELLLHLHVADLALSVPALEVLDLGPVWIEDVVVDEDRVPLDSAGVGRMDAVRVRVHRPDLLLDGLGVVGQEDGIPEALSHLARAVDARKHAALGNECLRNREDCPEELVEAPRHLTGQLDVRLLVATDGDEIAFDHEDVRGLQDRIPEEPVSRNRQVVVAHLVLQRRDALRPGHSDEHGEVEEELCDLGYERLEIDRALLGVDSHREVVGDELADVLTDLFEVRDPSRKHVVIGYQEKALVLILQLHPICERAVVVPEVEALCGRTIAREDALPRLLRGSGWRGGRDFCGHGKCDGTGSTRASSSATSRPTSSRFPTKKCSTPPTTAMRACGIAARSPSAVPTWRSSVSARPPVHSPSLSPTPRKLKRNAYQPRCAQARAIAATSGLRIVPPCVGSGCAMTTIAVGATSGMRSVASRRSSILTASSRIVRVCGNPGLAAAV